ncbi:MAG: hypothetical protein O2815_05465 [Actinomycetota bacterium]|nr:hypothetical protein [Actinomycetota bacterium]
MKQRMVHIAAITVTVLGLTAGCGGEQLAEQIGEQAINGEVDIEDDSITITDDEGNEFSAGGGTEIPESWPDDVPLFPDGELVLATSQSEGSATALWETTLSVDDAAAAYDAVLMSSGFTLDQDANISGTIARTYQGEVDIANVTVADVDGTTNVSVAVVPAS